MIAWFLALALVSEAGAKHKPAPDRAKSAEVKQRAERERSIQDCMADGDGDPDADREVCEDQVDP